MNCIEFSSRALGSFININTDRLASYKAAGHRSRYFGRLQLEHKAVTHCSRDKHLARPHINKKKYKEIIFLPCLVCLLRNENVNKYYQLQKGEDSAWWNKLVTYIQYVPKSCRKERTMSINYSATISINCTTGNRTVVFQFSCYKIENKGFLRRMKNTVNNKLHKIAVELFLTLSPIKEIQIKQNENTVGDLKHWWLVDRAS